MKKTLLAALLIAAALPAYAKDKDDNRHRKGRDPLSIPLARNGTLSGEDITSGSLKIIGFVVDQSGPVPVLNAVALLNAKSASREVANQVVHVPVRPTADAPVTAGSIGTLAFHGSPIFACDVLNLVLGPLHLELLGLVVDLNQVVLDITAQPGPGNLLGNLLCAILSLLDLPGAIATVIQLLDNLNGLLAVVGAL